METEVFRPRFSVLGIIVFFSLMILPLIHPLILTIMSDYRISTGLFIFIGIYSLFLGFIVEYARSVRIEITEEKLILKVWTITLWSCQLSQITSVENSYNPYCTSAFGMVSSFRNLCVRYKNVHGFSAYSRICPANEQEFLETLKKHNPNIIICVNKTSKKGWWRIWDWDI